MAFKSDQLPVVSIVVPLDNHAKVVGASIESCLAQAYPNVEVVLVDNCSSDSSVEIARSYEPRVRLIGSSKPMSISMARNVGLSHAIGDFVLFHESDDVLFPDRIWHDLEIVYREPQADIVISINRWFREGEPLLYNPEPMCRRERRLLRHMTSVSGAAERSIVSMLQYDGPQHSCMLYKTSVARAMGGYRSGTGPYTDREMLFRALCRGAKVAVNPRITSGWRLHDCEKRVAQAFRKDDHIHRLALAKNYAAALEQAGLLHHGPVLKALIAHVMAHVHDYAKRRHHSEIAKAALDLIASLTKYNGYACNTLNEDNADVVQSVNKS
jgi:glycosyltransferase involved in cell wall biosynthesis